MNNTKRALLMIALSGLVSCQAPALGAETNTNGPASPAPWRERMLEAAKELNLTDDQKERLKPIFQAMAEKARALRDDASLSPSERLQRVKALRDESAPEIKKVLTPEQFEKWEKLPIATPGLRLQEAIRELNLTDEQREKLKAIFRGPVEDFRAVQADTNLTAQQKMQKFNAAREKVAPKVKDVLTAQQYEKYLKQADRVGDELKRRFEQDRPPN